MKRMSKQAKQEAKIRALRREIRALRAKLEIRNAQVQKSQRVAEVIKQQLSSTWNYATSLQ